MKSGPREAAEIVACECVTLAETKDHADWQLIQKRASNSEEQQQALLAEAAEQVEDEADEHLRCHAGADAKLPALGFLLGEFARLLDRLRRRRGPLHREHAKLGAGLAVIVHEEGFNLLFESRP